MQVFPDQDQWLMPSATANVSAQRFQNPGPKCFARKKFRSVFDRWVHGQFQQSSEEGINLGRFAFDGEHPHCRSGAAFVVGHPQVDADCCCARVGVVGSRGPADLAAFIAGSD